MSVCVGSMSTRGGRGDTKVLCREVLIDALSPLGKPGDGVAGGEGAIYLWARLPAGKLSPVPEQQITVHLKLVFS